MVELSLSLCLCCLFVLVPRKLNWLFPQWSWLLKIYDCYLTPPKAAVPWLGRSNTQCLSLKKGILTALGPQHLHLRLYSVWLFLASFVWRIGHCIFVSYHPSPPPPAFRVQSSEILRTQDCIKTLVSASWWRVWLSFVMSTPEVSESTLHSYVLS